jgi:membrane protease subunit HflK
MKGAQAMQWDNTPGGAGSGREFTPDDLLQYMRKFKPSSGKAAPVVVAVLAIILVLWLVTGVYIVGADEEGVVRRFGKVVRTTGSGPHYHLPAPFESVLKPKVTKVFRTEIGFRTISQGPPAKYESIVKEARMLTGDENIIVIWFAVQFKISDSMSYLFNVRDPEKTLRASAEAAMREVIGSNDIDTALTTGKAEVESKSQILLQEIMDSYESGIIIEQVKLQTVEAPSQVIPAFKDVASAREDRVKLINQSEGYRNDILPKAQGEAAQMVARSEAYSAARVSRAQGDAERFNKVVTEYFKARDVTRDRLYIEAMEEIVGKADRIILDSKAAGAVLPFLPLGRQGTATPPATTSGQ